MDIGLHPASAQASSLTIRSVSAVAVEVPMRFALGTSAATVRAAPLLLVDLATEQGIVGRTYLFCYRTSAARPIAAVLEDAVGDRARRARRACRDRGNCSAAALRCSASPASRAWRCRRSTCALWDALAVAAGMPLATLLGAAPRPIPAYNSCGLGLMAPEAAADEAELLLERGFKAVKLRLGYPTLTQDIAVTRAVRKRVPGACRDLRRLQPGARSSPEALERGRALEAKASRGSRSRSATTISRLCRAGPRSRSCRCSSARTSMGRTRWCRRCAPAHAIW